MTGYVPDQPVSQDAPDGSEIPSSSSAVRTSALPRPTRVCATLGCSTILSTYNPSEVCWLHTRPSFRTARDQ